MIAVVLAPASPPVAASALRAYLERIRDVRPRDHRRRPARGGRAGVARARRGAEADAGAEARRLRHRAATRSCARRCGCWASGRRIGSLPCPTAGTRCSGTASPATTRSTTSPSPIPATGVGFWIRYTMVAPLPETGEEATCSLWFMAMDPARPGRERRREGELPGRRSCSATAEPFELRIGDAVADRPRHDRARSSRTGAAANGTCAGSRACRPTATCTRSCARRRSRRRSCSCRTRTSRSAASVEIGGRRIDVAGARGGQAHLWGSKHADALGVGALQRLRRRRRRRRARRRSSTASACSCRASAASSAPTRRSSRASAARTCSRSAPLAVQRNRERVRPRRAGASRRARGGASCVGDVTARREDLVGVTYHDPDGELAYCYNTEVADMRLEVFERAAAVHRLAQGGRAALGAAARTSSTRSASRRGRAR